MNALSSMAMQLAKTPSMAKVRAAERAALTPRELEVAAFANRGDTYPEIAGTMGLSVKTIETHVHNVVRKVGARNMRHACWLLRCDSIINDED